MDALLNYLEERQRDLLAQLESIRAIRTLLISQREKASLLSSANAIKEVNRILLELPHSALTPQIRDIANSAKQAILEQAVQRIQLQAEALGDPPGQPAEPASIDPPAHQPDPNEPGVSRPEQPDADALTPPMGPPDHLAPPEGRGNQPDDGTPSAPDLPKPS
jgi:hypothetical protein